MQYSTAWPVADDGSIVTTGSGKTVAGYLPENFIPIAADGGVAGLTGSGGGSIATDMYFANTAARNTWTTNNPTRLLQGITCAVTNGSGYDYYQWDSNATTWRAANLIFQGVKGDTGLTGVFVGTLMAVAFNFAPTGWALCNGQLLQISSYPQLYSVIGTTYGGDGVTTFAVPDLRGRAAVGAGAGAGLPSVAFASKGGSSSTTTSVTGTTSFTLAVDNLPSHNHNASFSGTTSPATATVASQAVSVSGSVKIGNNVGGGSTNVVDGAILTKAAGGQGAIYAATGTADLNIGPEQTFTGTVAGQTLNFNTTAAGTVTTDNTGNGTSVTAPVTASGTTETVSPYLGVNYIIATAGVMPV